MNLDDRMRDASRCMVCGADSEGGMKMRFARWGSEGAAAQGQIPAFFGGFGGLAHGGAIAALLDDAMWWAIQHTCGADTLTAELKVRYHVPIEVQRKLWVQGRLLKRRGRLYRAEAAICSEEGAPPLAEASGSFMTPDDRTLRGR